MSVDFFAEAEQIETELIEQRRDFHQHPELAFEEFRTAGIVAEKLQSLGLEVQTGIGKTGVVGILEGDGDGPTILYRADMDALPVEEANDVPYVSTVKGKMHACGHDEHTTIALGIAKLLSKHRHQLNGRVKFVFQPAEEIGAGAHAMIADGVMESPKPDMALGIHLWNDLEVGTVSLVSGPAMSGVNGFEVTVTGKGGHGAMPHQTVDPIVCASHMIVALQSIVSRNVDPVDTVVVTVGKIQGGDAPNVIPQTVTFAGSYRIFREESRDFVTTRLTEIVNGVATAMGCTADVKIQYGMGAVINDAEIASRIDEVITRHDHIQTVSQPWMASEDVSMFFEDNPGLYLLVGSANAERGLDYAHHHQQFDFDERVLSLSVGLMSAVIADYLQAGE